MYQITYGFPKTTITIFLSIELTGLFYQMNFEITFNI